MIISCPECAKRYDVDAHLIPEKGRKVRCVVCSHEWRQLPDLLQKIDSDPAIKQLHDVTRPMDVVQKARGKWIARSVWSVLCLGILVALIVFPQDVVRILPKTKALYGWAGIDVLAPGEGLALTNLQTRYVNGLPDAKIHIEGDVVNTTDHVVMLAPLHVYLLSDEAKCAQKNSDGQCLLSKFDYELQGTSLLPGEQTHFIVEHKAPSQPVTFVSVEF